MFTARCSRVLMLLWLSWALVADLCVAGKFNARLSVGDIAPSWQSLPGVDGRKHSRADLQDARLTVVIFTCNHCPIAKAYERIFAELDEKHRPQGVRFVAISCSLYEGDDLPRMKERASAAAWKFPYLHDASQRTGQAYGASVTPQVFVLDAQGKIAYMGAIDDGHGRPDRAERHYLREAIEALLAGKPLEVAETKAVGCGIVYE